MFALNGPLGPQVRPTHAERACLDALPHNAGFQFTAAVQRSRRARRPVNAGLLALSILPDEVRRDLLAEWITSGAGTSSFFATQGDTLLDFIAKQLPDPSPELAVCRFEQFTLRANSEVASFKPGSRATGSAQPRTPGPSCRHGAFQRRTSTDLEIAVGTNAAASVLAPSYGAVGRPGVAAAVPHRLAARK